MRISAREEYAIRAMLDLTLQHGQGLVPIEAVARRQGIPQRYLEQVLLSLKRVGFLGSKRGASGGYRLAREPDTISVGEVLRAVEGSLAHEVGRRGRARDGAADLGDLWDDIGRAVASVVDRTTFAQLADRVRARRQATRPVYHI
jgi:Rrf2 family protein